MPPKVPPTLLELEECKAELESLLKQECKLGQDDPTEMRAMRSALKIIKEMIEESYFRAEQQI